MTDKYEYTERAGFPVPGFSTNDKVVRNHIFAMVGTPVARRDDGKYLHSHGPNISTFPDFIRDALHKTFIEPGKTAVNIYQDLPLALQEDGALPTAEQCDYVFGGLLRSQTVISLASLEQHVTSWKSFSLVPNGAFYEEEPQWEAASEGNQGKPKGGAVFRTATGEQVPCDDQVALSLFMMVNAAPNAPIEVYHESVDGNGLAPSDPKRIAALGRAVFFLVENGLVRVNVAPTMFSQG